MDSAYIQDKSFEKKKKKSSKSIKGDEQSLMIQQEMILQSKKYTSIAGGTASKELKELLEQSFTIPYVGLYAYEDNGGLQSTTQ